MTRQAEQKNSIASILQHYHADSPQLLGYVMNLNYDEVSFVTCDSWKMECGGVPKGTFILLKIKDEVQQITKTYHQPPMLIFCQVIDAVPTPVSQDTQRMLFQLHKVQGNADLFTKGELQWGGLKAAILGTYYDQNGIQFGGDVAYFVSPHHYEVYVPTRADLQTLITHFVPKEEGVSIGRLRYTETEFHTPGQDITINISPADFVASRSAFFGKTRQGKSNTIKIILDMMLRARTYTIGTVGQVIFDLSGEYTYPDKQTQISIPLRYPGRCSRYSLNPREVVSEQLAGLKAPAQFSINFYQQVKPGHMVMRSLWNNVHTSRPGYLAPFLDGDLPDPEEIKKMEDSGEKTRAERTLSMYLALLQEAGFKLPKDQPCSPLRLHAELKSRLAENEMLSSVKRDAKHPSQLAEQQPLSSAVLIYKALYTLYMAEPQNSRLFPADEGESYFDPVQLTLLQMIGRKGITGARFLTPFQQYHAVDGSDIEKRIVDDVRAGKTVFIDLSQAEESVAKFYSEQITRAILTDQMKKFAEQDAEKFAKHSVLFYFEEAHNLFRADDKDLGSIYNKLAKEGAKFRIGMVYATQSITTLSPDLLKNSENFFITHLNDDREIRELERRYEFRHTGTDIQRAKTAGFLRLITRSYRYVLPVQIRLFQAEENEPSYLERLLD